MYVITSLFTTNSTVTTDMRNHPIAISHYIHYPAFNLTHDMVILHDKKYLSCFVEQKHKLIILDRDHVEIEMDKLDDQDD
jgi:hypothetical protein